ncbi:MAG: hypothetical protein AAB733_04130, partial [Patescibacteria group bacterium]
VCLLCAYKIWGTIHAHPEFHDRDRALSFMWTYFCLSATYALFGLPVVFFPENSLLLGWTFIFAHLGFVFAIANFATIPVSFYRPHWRNATFNCMVVVGLLLIALMVSRFSYPVFDSATQIIDWNLDSTVGLAIAVFFLGVLVPAIGFFAFQAGRSHLPAVKVRSLLLSFGLLFLVIGTVLFYAVSFTAKFLVVNLVSVVGFLFVLVSIYYKSTRVDASSEEPPQTIHL